MVALPRLEDYAPAELARLEAASPAVARYRRLLERADLDPLKARRHRAWLACAAATLLDRAEPAAVCAHWSDVADEVLRSAWRDAGLDQHPALLVALGKLGAGELNLSSDVDLVVVAEPDAVAAVTKRLRAVQRRLGDGEDGLGLRLDFDLRPGGARGPLVTTPAQAQDHYWSQGETWERLALVRLRPLIGPADLAAQVEDLARRFSYRKYLDFTLLDDLKQLRAAVHQRGFTRRAGEIHLKLEVGGIRDVELFVHAHQVLNGGKQPAVRTRSTDEALALLARHGILTAAAAERLRRAYWDLRGVENRVQAHDDRQTHVLAADDAAVPSVRRTMTEVDQLVSTLLGEVDAERARLPLTPTEQAAWLRGLGFGEDSVRDTWPTLIGQGARGHRLERDERARREVLYAFVTALARQTNLDRDLGLSVLADLNRATRAKATFFSTLRRVPALIEDLARVFCLSPYLGALLAGRPELLDHLILPVADAWSADPAAALAQMSERRQLTELWAATHLLGHGAPAELFARVTAVADEIAGELLRQLHAECGGHGVRVVTLGKWGGGELGLRSDLDFIFVTDAPPGPAEFRVARRFITRLTDPGRFGALYDVDLRLRPSGRAGPLMVTTDRLDEYWRTEAAPWERQAALRARPLGGPLPRPALAARPLSPADLDELKRIRRKLLRPAAEDSFDLKHVPGGLIDIEFVAQTALLARGAVDAPTSTLGMIDHLAARDPAWTAHAASLAEAYRELRLIEQHLQLASTSRLGPVTPIDRTLARAAAGMGTDAAALWTRLNARAAEARRSLNVLDPTGLRI